MKKKNNAILNKVSSVLFVIQKNKRKWKKQTEKVVNNHMKILQFRIFLLFPLMHEIHTALV